MMIGNDYHDDVAKAAGVNAFPVAGYALRKDKKSRAGLPEALTGVVDFFENCISY